MAQLSHLLLFDPDPNGLHILTSAFERDGCAVSGSGDPARVLELAQSTPFSVLVLNICGAEQRGLEALRAVAANPRTRNLPCVTLGMGSQRTAALSAGAFAFLTVPFVVRDVIGVCRMVAAASVPGSRPSPDAELSMQLQELGGIYFLIRALVVTGRSAVVEVRRSQNRGELRFTDGSLTAITVGTIQGLAALHHLLLWEEAALHFKFRNVVRRGAQLSMKSGEVLEECDRFLRDFAHEAKGLGVARTIYAAQLDRVQPSAAFPTEALPILKLFDGRRDLAQVLGESPFRIFDTLKIIKRFVSDGAVQLQTPIPPVRGESGQATGPSALDYWLQRPAPLLGSELGDIKPGANGTVDVAVPSSHARGGGRMKPAAKAPGARSGTSPFAVRGGTGGPSRKGPGAPATQQNRPHQRSSEGVPVAVPHANPRSMSFRREEVVTPPPVSKPLVTPAKRTSLVARGEIKITPVSLRSVDSDTPERPQSVVVDLGPLPPARPLVPTAPPPISAHVHPPSVIIAPLTPLPELIRPMAPVAPPPSVIVAPLMRSPAAVQPGAPSAPPSASAATRPPSPRVAPPHAAAPPHVGNANTPVLQTSSDSFNAVESDFFDREADLYKRESVETFDDLDSHTTNGVRKR